MTPSTKQLRAAGTCRAFTLIELLVAMAVMAMVLVLMLQVTTSIMGSTRAQNRQMDSVATSRRALDVMSSDLQSALINDSRTILVPDSTGSNSLFTLYAHRRGPNGATDHRFLAVEYKLRNNTTNIGTLVRAYCSESFADLAPPSPRKDVELANGILAVQVRVLTESGPSALAAGPPTADWSTDSYNGISTPAGQKALIFRGPSFADHLTNRATGIELWVAAADPQTTSLLTDLDQWNIVVNKLESTPDPQNWREEIDSLPNLPASAKSAIRILSKIIPLP